MLFPEPASVLAASRRAGDSLERLLLLCLDEQGLSPWLQRNEKMIADAVWQKVWVTWTEKQEWAGCHELGKELAEQWL
jgi:hypothetical protein